MAGRSRRTAFACLLGLSLALSAAPALADEPYEDKGGAHPVRLIAYAAHPVGFVIDWVLLRPAHWIVSHQPFRAFFGHTD